MRILVVLATLGLVGCGEIAARRAVKSELIDPGSAMFRDMRKVDDFSWCGEVNSKNRMGGYVGYRRFYAMGDFVVFDDDESSAAILDARCAN